VQVVWLEVLEARSGRDGGLGLEVGEQLVVLAAGEFVDDCAERLVVECVVGGERTAERRAADVVGVEERREDVEELLDLRLL
jgi:hypothetical protein